MMPLKYVNKLVYKEKIIIIYLYDGRWIALVSRLLAGWIVAADVGCTPLTVKLGCGHIARETDTSTTVTPQLTALVDGH